jgi:4-hydroxy-tetrahydrodipicolinate reductase
MKILLIGHGRMGHLVESTAISQGDSMAGIIDIGNLTDLETIGKVADIAIDFSSPKALPSVAAYVQSTGTPLLSGVTGCTDADLALFDRMGQFAPVLHSANYSLGVAVLRQAVAQVAKTLRPDFDIEIIETHHNQKVDAPSGTAKLLLNAVDPKGELTPVYGREGQVGKREKNEIGIHALRGGTEAGTHTVAFFGTDETLEFTHRATSRQIFVNGALYAARRLVTLPKGNYQLDDVLFGGTSL